MEVWFEKQLFRNSRGCLCVEGREGLETALHPFSNGIEARGAGFTASSFWVAGVKYTFVHDYEGISVFG